MKLFKNEFKTAVYLLLKPSVVFFLFLILISCSDTQTTEKGYGLIEQGKLKGAIVSGYVVDAVSGEVIGKQNEGTRMTPASLSKVLTSGAALIKLGDEYRFETKVGVEGSINSGVLNGNVVITGGGDPTLGSKYFPQTHPDSVFSKIFAILRSNGINKVNGELKVVTGCRNEPGYPSLRLWEDMSNYYGAPPYCLSFIDNTFTVTLSSPSVAGKLCHVKRIEPECGIKPDCRVVSSESNKDSAYIYGFPGLKNWYINGSIPSGRDNFRIKGALPFPERVFGNELLRFLRDRGMGLLNMSVIHSGGNGKVRELGAVYSPPVKEIIKVLNKKSINLFADGLFLKTGEKKEQPDWDNARVVVKNIWTNAIGENDIFLHDGSGLSPFNSFTPKDMVNALMYLRNSAHAGVFKASLAVSGVDGTFKRIWNDVETRRKVIGKSGYMSGVLGYAGYIKADSGRELVFCIMINRFTEPVGEVRKMIEKYVTRIIKEN